jgi:hypothetical protein
MIYTSLAQLYRGDVVSALATYQTREQRYTLSGMPRLSTWRLLRQWGTMITHLAAVERGIDATRNLAAAEDRIKQLERERIAWPQPFIQAGRAALHQARGNTTQRDLALARAIKDAHELGYRPFAQVFTLAAAQLAGDGAAAARAEESLSAFGIASPERWRKTWAPGLG